MRRLTCQLRELRKALLLAKETVYYVDYSLFPRYVDVLTKDFTKIKACRGLRALAVLQGFNILPIRLKADPLAAIIVDSIAFPVRPQAMSFEIYEMAVVLIRDGYKINDAFKTAYLLV